VSKILKKDLRSWVNDQENIRTTIGKCNVKSNWLSKSGLLVVTNMPTRDILYPMELSS